MSFLLARNRFRRRMRTCAQPCTGSPRLPCSPTLTFTSNKPVLTMLTTRVLTSSPRKRGNTRRRDLAQAIYRPHQCRLLASGTCRLPENALRTLTEVTGLAAPAWRYPPRIVASLPKLSHQPGPAADARRATAVMMPECERQYAPLAVQKPGLKSQRLAIYGRAKPRPPSAPASTVAACRPSPARTVSSTRMLCTVIFIPESVFAVGSETSPHFYDSTTTQRSAGSTALPVTVKRGRTITILTTPDHDACPYPHFSHEDHQRGPRSAFSIPSAPRVL